MNTRVLLARYRHALACLPEEVPPEQLTGLREERAFAQYLHRRPRHRWWRSGRATGYIFESFSLALADGSLLLHAVAPEDDTPARRTLAACGFPVRGSTLGEAVAAMPRERRVDYAVLFRHESCRVQGALRFRTDELVVVPFESLPRLAPPPAARA